MTTVERDFVSLIAAGVGLQRGASLSEKPDWEGIYRLAEQHAVLGILAEACPPEAPIAEMLFEDSMEIVRRNKQVNEVLADVVRYLRENGVETILQKGQGVAQCYPNPMLRMSGDIDLLVREEDYDRAKAVLQRKLSIRNEDHRYKDLHSVFWCGEIEIELHGSEFGSMDQDTRARYSVLCREMFQHGEFRSYVCEGVDIGLAPATFDAFYIFLHLVKHYHLQGIGFRQMLDLCLFLKVNECEMDYHIIRKWVERFQLTREWAMFTDIWNNELLLSLILEQGNMGRARSSRFSRYYLVRLLQIVPINYRFARRYLIFSKWMVLSDFWRNNLKSVRHFWNHRVKKNKIKQI